MKCVVVDHPFGVASIKLPKRSESGALGVLEFWSGSAQVR
jgi:hypothetical protein